MSSSRNCLAEPASNGAIGAARQPRDLPEGALGLGVATFLEHEHRHADQAELAGEPGQLVDILLHAVADIDQRVDLAGFGFALGMRQHLADLREAALARHLPHQPRQRVGIAHPFRRLALAVAAEIDELHVEPADRLDRLEHVGLKLEREVPGRLPAHGGVHGEDQPALARAGWLERPHILEEGVDLRPRRPLRSDLALRRLCRGFRLGHALRNSASGSFAQAIDGPLIGREQCRISPPRRRRRAGSHCRQRR